MRTLAVIPARYRSTRLPGKVLADIGGRPMVELVFRRVGEARLVDRVLVATDEPRVKDRVIAFGAECVLTSPEHASGTDRVAEAAADLDCEIVVNVQADEPLIDPAAIDQAVAACIDTQGRAITTLCKVITTAEELWDPNVVKVVTDPKGFALYFSRWPIPFVASPTMSFEELASRFQKSQPMPEGAFHKHIGLYAYPKPLLMDFSRGEPSRLERLERLEQLRALEKGIPIRVQPTDYENVAVDTADDLERVRKRILGERTGSRG